MAGFTKQQLENLKLEPENLASIKDAVQETFYNDEDFSSFVNIMKVKNNDPIALIGEMEMVGIFYRLLLRGIGKLISGIQFAVT